MLRQAKAPDHVICLKINGLVAGNDIAQYRNLLEECLRASDKISICIDIYGLTDMDAEPFAIGAQADLELLQHLDQLERFALVTNKRWLHAIVNFVMGLFPTMKIRVFDQSESEPALKWASINVKPPAPRPAAVSFIPTNRKKVLAFEIDGVITATEFPKVIDEFQHFFVDHDSAHLLNRMTGFKGVEPAIFSQSGLIAMKLAGLQKVDRYAIIGAPRWIAGAITKMNDFLPQIDMRVFDPESEPNAWTWLEAEPLEAAA